MAHKGKFYKLQFRRDLAAQPNNNTAYPEAADFSSSCLGGTVGASLSGRHIIVVNLLKETQPPMVWVSAPFNAAGTMVHYIVTIHPQFEFADVTVDFEVIRDSDGAVLYKNTGGVMDVGSVPSFWFADGNTQSVQTPQVHGTCGPQRYLWVFADYSIYNP